jgi:hypothetical protein
MSVIRSLSYDTGGPLKLTLYDPDEGATSDITAVDVEAITLLAVDSTHERRVPVEIAVDGNHIVRVETKGPAPTTPDPDPGHGVVVTRIATQRVAGDKLLAEIFTDDPSDDRLEEKQVNTLDPLMHILCHGAFLSRRRLKITPGDGTITRVVKERRLPSP